MFSQSWKKICLKKKKEKHMVLLMMVAVETDNKKLFYMTLN